MISRLTEILKDEGFEAEKSYNFAIEVYVCMIKWYPLPDFIECIFMAESYSKQETTKALYERYCGEKCA